MTANRALAREMLEQFPCPYTMDGHCRDKCAAEHEWTCEVLPIYRDYLALRAVVVAELSGENPALRAKGWREFSKALWPPQWESERAARRAAAWEGIATCQE